LKADKIHLQNIAIYYRCHVSDHIFYQDDFRLTLCSTQPLILNLKAVYNKVEIKTCLRFQYKPLEAIRDSGRKPEIHENIFLAT